MLKTLLMTGAAGNIGVAIRPFLATIAETVLLSDLAEVGDLAPHERFQRADISVREEVDALFAGGVDGVLNLGGVSVERPFEMILQANLIGAYHMFDAARLNGKPRMIFASSNHVMGYYRRDERLDASSPPRPDSLYGVSKAYGEALASLYFDKFGVESLCVRIGSCFPEPADPRMLATWLAIEDFVDLCARAFAAPRLGRTIVYGASDNEEQWWDNREAAFLGWRPRHSSEKFRADVVARAEKQDPFDPAVVFQGGKFVPAGHPDE